MPKPHNLRNLLFVFAFLLGTIGSSGQDADSTVVIGSVSLSGNKETKDYIILRELTFKPGDTLTIKQLQVKRDRALRQLVSLSLFTSVTMEFYPNEVSGALDITIFVKERWYLFVFPIVEIADRNFNTWWRTKDLRRLNYGARLTRFNLRGRNETMRVSLQVGFTKKASLDYLFPYINKKLTLGLAYNLTLSSNGEVWYATQNNKLQQFKDPPRAMFERFKTSATLFYRKKIYTTHYLEFGYTHLKVADTVVSDTLNPDYFLDRQTIQKSLQLNYKFVFDFRDVKAYPLNGKYLSVELNNNFFLGNKSIDNLSALFTTASYMKKIRPRHYYSLVFQAKASLPKRQPYYNIRALGYDYNIRGFEYYVIDGQHFAIGKANYSYNIIKQRQFYLNSKKLKKFRTIPLAVYAKAYLDAGYVYAYNPRPGNTYENSMLAGYGAGFDIVTYYDRVLRVEYSFTNKGQSGLFLHFTSFF